MTRGQRTAHWIVWLALAPLLLLLVTLAVRARSDAYHTTAAAAARRHRTMSQTFVAVQWNRRKYVYDAVLVVGIAAYLTVFRRR